MEEILIKNIENGIRAIKLGTKTPITANLSGHFSKLKPLNEGLYQDLLKKYGNVVNEFNKK